MRSLILSFFGSTREQRIRNIVGKVVAVVLVVTAVKFLEGVAVLAVVLGGGIALALFVNFYNNEQEREKWNSEMKRPLGSRAPTDLTVRNKR